MLKCVTSQTQKPFFEIFDQNIDLFYWSPKYIILVTVYLFNTQKSISAIYWLRIWKIFFKEGIISRWSVSTLKC